jgi:hypothetical protein
MLVFLIISVTLNLFQGLLGRGYGLKPPHVVSLSCRRGTAEKQKHHQHCQGEVKPLNKRTKTQSKPYIDI